MSEPTLNSVSSTTDDNTPNIEGRIFWRFATSGVFFQGGAASVETNTIISALVQGLTGSPLAVGAAAAISRYGWIFHKLLSPISLNAGTGECRFMYLVRSGEPCVLQ